MRLAVFTSDSLECYERRLPKGVAISPTTASPDKGRPVVNEVSATMFKCNGRALDGGAWEVREGKDRDILRMAGASWRGNYAPVCRALERCFQI